jgi:hypothetical protein
MAQSNQQNPQAPRSAEPPPELVELIRDLRHPDIVNVGLTTTTNGDWAAMVRVKPGARTPLPGIGSTLRGYPVVYQRASSTLPVARPAFPEEER